MIRYRGEPGQLVDVAVTELRRIARKNKSQITLLVRVGDGVSASAAVAHVLGPAPSDRALSRCLLVRTERSLAHDPLYALRLLADIGLRALSAAVNDPTTAVRALDEIEDVLRTASRLPLGTARHVSGEGCVVLPRPTWADIVDLALLEILEAGIHAPQVTRRLTALLADLLADLPEQSSSPLLRYQRHLTAAISRTVSVEDQSVYAHGRPAGHRRFSLSGGEAGDRDRRHTTGTSPCCRPWMADVLVDARVLGPGPAVAEHPCDARSAGEELDLPRPRLLASPLSFGP